MRILNTVKNSFASIIKSFIPSIFGFISRTIFINTLGATYLGVNGLFANIFTMLSLVELGIGPAITYFMYQPIAENNYPKINQLMGIFKKLYTIIGIVILVLGILVIPYLDYFVNSTEPIPNLEVFYILLLINTVVSYFFAYKRAIFSADQKDYINSINDSIFTIVRHLIQIAFLLLTKSFIIYLIINIVMTLVSNVRISQLADKQYPFLKDKNSLTFSSEDKKMLTTRIAAIFSHRIGGVVAVGTDNLFLSLFSNVQFIGVYSNYTLITGIINGPLSQVFSSMTASVGNLDVSASKEKSYSVFKNVFFLNFCLYGFASICLYFLLNPFIELWLGDKYILDEAIVLVTVINFYIFGLKMSAEIFNMAKGLFYNTRFKPLLEAVVDIVATIGLGLQFGAIGVLLGTTVGLITVSFWIDPFVLYKHWFKKPVANYFVRFSIYTAAMLFVILMIRFLLNLPMFNNLPFVVLTILVVSLTVSSFFVIFCFTDEMRYYMGLLKGFISKIRGR